MREVVGRPSFSRTVKENFKYSGPVCYPIEGFAIERLVSGISYSGATDDGDTWFELLQYTRGSMNGKIVGQITLEQDFPFNVVCRFQ